METARIAAISLIMGFVCFHLAKEIAAGARSGKIRYGRGAGERVVLKSKEPLLFWFLMMAFLTMAVAGMSFAAWLVLRAF